MGAHHNGKESAMGKPYTPTTDEVRRDFVMLNETQHPTVTSADLGAEFDRWLNEVKAQAWDRGHGAPCDEWWDSDMCREYLSSRTRPNATTDLPTTITSAGMHGRRTDGGKSEDAGAAHHTGYAQKKKVPPGHSLGCNILCEARSARTFWTFFAVNFIHTST